MIRIKWLAIAVLLVALVMGQPVLADDGATSAVLGQDFVLEEGERLAEDLMIVGGQAHLKPGSVVDGNLTQFGGTSTVEGMISGDVVAIGGTLYLRDTALVHGDLVVFGNVERSPGATVRGNIIEGWEAASRISSIDLSSSGLDLTEGSVSGSNSGTGWLGGLGRRIGGFLLSLLFAALIVLLLPKQLDRTVSLMQSDWALSFGVGLLTYVVVGILAVVFALLVLVCIGLPLLVALAVALLYGAAMGWSAAGRLLGERLVPLLHLNRTDALTETLVGTAVITLIALVPCFGLIAAAIVLCWGLGATVLVHVQDLQGTPTPSQAPSSTGARQQTRSAGRASASKDTQPLKPRHPDTTA